jgi:uncharacterized membrane protein
MRLIPAAAIAACLLWSFPAWSQSPPVAEPASAAHVLEKTVTLATADAAALLAIFSVGTGNLRVATALTTGTMVLGTFLYPVNEYLWDYFSPNTNLSANNKSFDTSASLWRTTYKYLTFKVSITTSKFAWIYLYTGSAISMFTLGTASSLVLPVVFYLNNTAWDWYDWGTAVPAPKQ